MHFSAGWIKHSVLRRQKPDNCKDTARYGWFLQANGTLRQGLRYPKNIFASHI